MGKPVLVPGWLLLSLAVVIAANLVANTATNVTIELMQGASEFAHAVRVNDLALLPLVRCVLYPTLIGVSIAYLWPLIAYFRCGATGTPSARVRRRAVSAPVVTAAIGFSGWVASISFFSMLTLVRYGHWSTDLMSQHVLSPLVNGFLAATTSYLVVDWVFRTRVIPQVFPDGQVTQASGATALGVGARLMVFLVAVAFVPLFTMLGLVRAAAARLDVGRSVAEVIPHLLRASEATFGLYVALGLVLTLLLARTFTRPLAEVTAALRRVRAGRLDQPVRVSSADEIGVLEEGVNAMAATLQERERILQTFGRVVEPVVRDRLLSGDLRGEGEVRTASVLFCDLRDFTSFAERTAPRELVRTLNQFFTTMTTWARECGGFVDKFIGDGLLVVFGLFADDVAGGPAAGAAAAVRCALGMRERLAHLNEDRVALGHPPLAMKIGVHTGPVIAGTIGAADRHEYTVIGDTVNVAARLEALCRDHGCEAIISAATWELARAGGAKLPPAQLDAVTLRGRDESVRVYRVG
ncbi:MAG: adenylate/guanylate cyclase domain-containing protein [Candidatus Binatia bacterium]